MAKKKSKMTAKAPPPTREESVRFRMRAEYKAWLEGLATECDLTVADTIAQSLIAFGKSKGYSPPPNR